MIRFTSWDANVFLCLISCEIPEDVVKVMMKVVKKTHEEFSLEEAFSYWNTNSPRLVRWRLTQPLERGKFEIANKRHFGISRQDFMFLKDALI